MSLCMATYRGIPSVPHYGVLTVACGRLPGKGLPSAGILLRRSKPAGIYLFTLNFPAFPTGKLNSRGPKAPD